MEIIDTHCYIGSNRNIPDIAEISVESYLALKQEIRDKQGHDARFIVMPYSDEGNYRLPSLVENNPCLLLGGIVQVNPRGLRKELLGYSSPSEVARLIETGTIVGLKHNTAATASSVDDSSVDEFAALASDAGIPWIAHCSATSQKYSHPDMFRRLRDRHPELKIKAAHYGGLDERYIPYYIELASDDPLFYLGTEGLSGQVSRWDLEANPPRRLPCRYNPERWTRKFLDTVISIPEKVVFGSDFPELSFDLHPIHEASSSLQHKVFFANPACLFGITVSHHPAPS